MKKTLTSDQQDALLETLHHRFDQNPTRHPKLKWEEVEKKLRAHPDTLWSLQQMEETGGEPDVVTDSGEIRFVDCAPESPKGRRSLCYDPDALASRKEHKPKGSAVGLADEIGIEILTEEQYRHLQTLGEFDTKTSTWLKTPDDIRKLGGAVFGDRRYDTVFLYHNGAESYYASRGFRGVLIVR